MCDPLVQASCHLTKAAIRNGMERKRCLHQVTGIDTFFNVFVLKFCVGTVESPVFASRICTTTS